MRNVVILTAMLAAAPATAAETVQLSKSSYFDQHVTVLDRGDHYLIHFNVYVRLDDAPGENLRFLHASVAFNRGDFADVAELKRSVRLSANEETWSFYFRVPKFANGQTETLYAVVVNVDGISGAGSAVWKFDGGRVEMGSRDNPLSMTFPVGRTIRQDNDDGSFKLVVVYETKQYVNNYDDLPISGFAKPGKEAPEVIDGERSAKRLEQ